MSDVLRIEVDASLNAVRVIQVLEQIINVHGSSERLWVDHGPELTSAAFTDRCESRGFTLEFIAPGKPNQNGFIERASKASTAMRCSMPGLFISLDEVRAETECWLKEYNLERHHESLGDVPPVEFLTQHVHAEVSIYGWP
jgi:putative transposase